MGVWLKRRLDDGPLEQCEYRVSTGDIDGSRIIELACPGCGETSTLDETIHTVHGNGVVSPIWICPSESCPCSDWIQLDGAGE